jgi:AraC-like DNA-binding protein
VEAREIGCSRAVVSDTLSEVLRAVRLTGAIYFSVDATPPWVAEAAPSREIAPRIMAGVEHVIEYHVITEGSCFASIVGEPPIRVEAGDVVAFPQGDAHVLSSAPGMRGGPGLDEILHADQRFPVTVSLRGGGAERTTVVCGFLGCDARPFNPLLANLPRLLHVRGGERATVLRRLVELALAESSAPRSGSECVLSRVSELLFVEVVRQYADALPPENAGWFSGLRDPTVGRALERIHARPAHPWTLEELAKESAASRSILAERFTHFVGIPPIQYLAEWRMQLAANLLRSSTATLAEIAERVGYGSEAALSRAFKRLTGATPASFRRG